MKTVLLSVLSAALLSLSPANVRADLSQKDARKVIQTMFGSSLPSSAVHVQQVRTNAEGAAEVSAQIEAVFRAKQVDGDWRLSEIRTGQDSWEQLDLIAQALHVKLPAGGCDTPRQVERNEAALALTVKRARCLVAELLGVTLPSDRARIKELSLFNLVL